MVNIDSLIKFSRQIGFKDNWPEQVNYMRDRLETVKLGFPGLGDKHFELAKYSDLKEGDKFIYDPCFISFNPDDDTPIMYSILDDNKLMVEGIGYGEDKLDKARTLRRWKDIVSSNFNSDTVVYKVIVRPTQTGGPGYYYFFKSYRDFRI